MILDQFDQDVLSASGKATDIIAEFYGTKLSQNSAKKYIAGIRKHLKHKRKLADTNQTNNLSEKVVKGDGSVTTKRMMILSESDSNDQFRIMQLNGFDPLKWELVSCKIKRNDWDVTMKLKEGERHYPHKETNHQYKIELTVKPIQEVLSSEYLIQVFEELELPTIKEYKYKPGRMMFELPIMDLHMGKLAWAEETGQDYDLKIAEQLYRETVDDLLGKLKQCNLPIEKCVLPIGQDFFHVDNKDSATTAGTYVDSDSRWQKMYAKGVNLLVWTIEVLREIAPVEVMYVPGNHDQAMSYYAIYTLFAQYQTSESVTVDISPTQRKYIRYGVNLIGYSHGKEGKRIEHLMQQERSEDWGETIYREWHLGDLHHEEAKEVGGVKIRRISSVTATDAWHAEKGYQSQRMAQAFVWDKVKGRQFVFDSNVSIAMV